MTKLKVDLEHNPGLKRRLELLDASPAMKKTEGLSADEIANLPESDKAAIRQAVEDAIKQVREEESTNGKKEKQQP